MDIVKDERKLSFSSAVDFHRTLQQKIFIVNFVFSEHTDSAEGFLRGLLCPVCSAVSAMVLWRTSYSRT